MFKKGESYRILIIDDGLLNQFILRKILSDDYEVEAALTASEGLKLIREFQPHLILLDIILPDENGFDVLVNLKAKEETHNIPVIVITGLDSEEDEEKGFLLGAVDYIKKPFKNAIVRARVNTQIHIVKQMQTIEQMGLIDALTGIPNRRAFDNQIQHEWRRAIREQSPLSMMMVDIDKFKIYNDSYGHPQGDIMLQSVAEALRTGLRRSTDLLYRYGGEEFAVLLPDTDAKGAVKVAECLRRNVENIHVPCYSTQTITHTTISIGLTTLQPKKEDRLQTFINTADRMLYKAKENGRNCVWCE